MKINRYNISPGTVLWFRKKNSWDVGSLTVKAVGQDGFTFTLKDGTEKRCSYEYASGRLFKDRSALSSYKPRIDMSNTYGGWSGKPNSWGESYDISSLVNETPPPEDDDWFARALQQGLDEG